jgi:putative flippase GtrA
MVNQDSISAVQLRVMRALRMSPGLWQIAMFVLVGGAATATHLTAALIAHELAHLPPLTSNFCGYCAAVMVSYFGHAILTFGRRVMHGPQFVRFIGTSLSTLALNQGIVYVGVNLLHLPFSLALIPAVILVPIASFVIAKLWAFAGPSGAKV